MTCRAALAAALAALQCGCAALPGKAPADEPEAARPAYRLEIDARADLAALLSTHLDLARFQSAPQAERISAAELDRLAAAAPAQARTLLQTEGYFAASVQLQREADGDALPLVRLRVDPGPEARVTTVALDAEGEVRSDSAGEALGALRAAWPLRPGERFRQTAWDAAKNAALAQLRAQGYLAAAWRETEARVDTSTNTVQLRAVALSGPLFRLGALRVEGASRYDTAVIERLATFGPGSAATERSLLDLQERLQKLGLFESVSVEIDPDVHAAQATPVTVRVRELPLQQANVGVGVSANTGGRLTLEHLHRQPFGLPWIAKNQAEYGSQRRAWQGDLTSHPVPGLYRNLVGASLEQLRAADEVRFTASARIGRTQDTQRIERLYYAEYVHERLENSAGTRRSEALSANSQWVFRNLDSVILPTNGESLSAQLAGGYARSTDLEDGPFGRTQARLTLWRPLGASWYASARAEAAQVIAKATTGVPDSLLFRAGGDESVRGYAYRSLGPIRDGTLFSGRALLTGSVEVARPVSRRLPSVWGAAFVDAGNAADSFGQLKPVVGYGLGVRWRSPVGPLRADVAYGQAVQRWRLHLSVGIAF
jgi:translocation and assembly module TamA